MDKNKPKFKIDVFESHIIFLPIPKLKNLMWCIFKQVIFLHSKN